MSKRNNLLHCVKCSDNRHPLASSGKSTKHAPSKAPPKQLNIQTLEQPNSQTHSNTFKHSNIVVLSTKTENRKRRARRQTKRTMSTSERANNWRRRNKWLKTVMIIDALYVLIMCQMDGYI